MSTLIGPGAAGSVPLPDDPAPHGLRTLATVTDMIGRANHVTSCAAWLLTTTGIALVLELEGLRGHTALPLLGALLPAAAAAGLAVRLLIRAAAATAGVAGAAGWSAGATADLPPTTEQVWDRLHVAAAAVQARELLARRALAWAAVSTAAFLAWSVAAAALG